MDSATLPRLVRLRSARASAVVEPAAGGRLVSLVIDRHEVLDAVPGPASPGWYRGSFPLAPWAGQLPGSAFLFDDVRYEVDDNRPGGAKHGVVAEREWIIEGTPAGTDVTLSVPFGPNHPGGWPFRGRAVQAFRLEDDALRMRLEVHSDAGRMPAVAGFHPWFKRSLDGGSTASVGFSPRQRLAAGPRGLHATDDLGERPWDDLFVGLREFPTVSWPGGPSLTLESAAPVWVYYERMPEAFCIEPWTGANGLNHDWVSVVTPGHPLILDLTIRF